VQENLQHIRNVLKLAVSDVALAFNVTRQAVYNWLNGEAIAESNVAKIEALADAADILQSAGVNVTASHLKRKFAHGKTLLQVSQSGGDVRDAAHLLVQTLAKETSQRARLKSRAHLHVRSVATADFDLPVSSN
jgi:transcriptional regulator with XRE-family HTH domain